MDSQSPLPATPSPSRQHSRFRSLWTRPQTRTVRRNIFQLLLKEYALLPMLAKIIVAVVLLYHVAQAIAAATVLGLSEQQYCPSLKTITAGILIKSVVRIPLLLLISLQSPYTPQRSGVFNIWTYVCRQRLAGSNSRAGDTDSGIEARSTSPSAPGNTLLARNMRWLERLQALLDLFSAVLFVAANYWVLAAPACPNAAVLHYGTLAWLLTLYVIIALPLLLGLGFLFCLPVFLVFLRVTDHRHQPRGSYATSTFGHLHPDAAMARDPGNNAVLSWSSKGLSDEEVARLPLVQYQPSSPTEPPFGATATAITVNPGSPRSPALNGCDLSTCRLPSPRLPALPRSPALSVRSSPAAPPLAPLHLSPDDALCVICLLEYTPGDPLRHLHCGHHFHRDCADHWLTLSRKCPLCCQNAVYNPNPSPPSTLIVADP
ncbi:hypothetical protein RI367_006965 [Sorochytrium milnesiophthora]